MATKNVHKIDQRCEVCDTQLQHVHCTGVTCAYHLVVCSQCDRAQAVVDSMRDHAKDCRSARAPLAVPLHEARA
jgi:hypothetical protein